MILHAMLQQMTMDGLHLSITPAGRIKALGAREAITRWLPVLQTRKTEIIRALAVQDFTEDMEERAAIMEFDGGMTRQEAEAAAFVDCKQPLMNGIGRHER